MREVCVTANGLRRLRLALCCPERVYNNKPRGCLLRSWDEVEDYALSLNLFSILLRSTIVQ